MGRAREGLCRTATHTPSDALVDHAAHASQPLNGTLESGARCILCEAQAVDMHLFLFAASEKSSRAFSKFEIVRMEPRNWEACEKCGAEEVMIASDELIQC